MRSDWYGWLEQRPWFRRDAVPADLYPLAVENLLQPSSSRKYFFQTVLRKALELSAGYQRLVSLMAKRSVGTVLTTNFDDLIAPQCARACGQSDTAMKSRHRLTTRCSIRRPTCRRSSTCTGLV